MAQTFPGKWRLPSALTSILLAGLVALGSTPARAITVCTDNEGVPIPLSNRVSLQNLLPLELPNIEGATVTIVPLDVDRVYNAGGDLTVADLDVSLKIKHPRVTDLIVMLHQRYQVGTNITYTSIPLLALSGCLNTVDTPGSFSIDYPSESVFNQDFSMVFDDAAPASSDFACDRSIPTLHGRYSPSTAGLGSNVSLAAFNGKPAVAGVVWTLVIYDTGNTGSNAALVEYCLNINGTVEGDVAPREETPTFGRKQSGNNIVIDQDYVNSAFNLLGYNLLDNRLIMQQEDELTRLPLTSDYLNARRSSATEYMRADAAPGSSFGDSLLTTSDFVQTARYAAALDEFGTGGGPTSGDDRIVYIGFTDPDGTERDNPVFLRGDTRPTGVSVRMRTKYAENEVGFGLKYDPDLLEFVRAQRGDCVPSNANFEVNRFDEDGLVGLRVTTLPDLTYPCDFTPKAPILGSGSTTSPTPVPDLTVDDTRTRPATRRLNVSTRVASVDFTGPLPVLKIDVLLDNEASEPVAGYDFSLLFEASRLRLLRSETSSGDFGVEPSVSFEDRLPLSTFVNDTIYAVSNQDSLRILRLSASRGSSTFTSGILTTLAFEVIPGQDYQTLLFRPSFDPIVVYAAPGAVTPIRIVDQAKQVFYAARFLTERPETNTNPIIPGVDVPLAELALVETAASASGCNASDLEFEIIISRNLVSVTGFNALIAFDNRVFQLKTIDAPNEGLSAIAEQTSIVRSGNTTFVGIAVEDFDTGLLNGGLARITLTSLVADPSGSEVRLLRLGGLDSIAVSNRDAVPEEDPSLFDNLTVDCSNKSVAAGLGNDLWIAPKGAKTAGVTTPKLTSRLSNVAIIDGRPRVSVELAVLGATAEAVTSYRFGLTYDSTAVTPVLTGLTEGGDGFGVLPTATLFESTNPLDNLNESSLLKVRRPASNYKTLFLTAQSATSTLRGTSDGDAKVLFTIPFDLVGKNLSYAPAIHLTTAEPGNTTVELAKFFFRAKAGTGTRATSLRFVNDPFTTLEPMVRNPGGVPIWAAFVDSSCTVLDSTLPPPTIRLKDTVLASGAEGIVQVVLDSVGAETAAGFTLKFDPTQLELLEISRGRDLPADAFFYTSPNENTPGIANTGDEIGRGLGQVKILTSLQPGNLVNTFAVGTRELVNLRFRDLQNPTTVSAESKITFGKLSDAMEVCDPNGLPLVARFPEGTIRVAGSDCTYALAPLEGSFDAVGTATGEGSFDVNVGSDGCPWVASTADAWITITGGLSGTDDGRVTFEVAPNDGPARTGTIEVVGVRYTVRQKGCTFAVSPSSKVFSGLGGTGTFTVVTEEPCSWQARSQVDWIIITNNGFGQGNGTVSYQVAANVGLPRTGRIVVGNQEYTVRQEICAYTLPVAASIDFAPSGGTGSFQLQARTTGTNPELGVCPWDAVETLPWLTITSATSGVGDATISFSVDANTADRRQGVILAGGQAFTVTQAGVANCNYEISSSQTTVLSTGSTGSQSFELTAQSGCPWEVTVDADWILLDGLTSGNGSATIRFTVVANTGISRVGRITVGGKVHQVLQLGGNQFQFGFSTGSENWNAFSVVPQFSEPTATFDAGTTSRPGRLVLTAKDNTNTFGYWQAPDLSLTLPAKVDDLFLLTMDVSSSTADIRKVPVFRVRASSFNFDQTNEFVVSSAPTDDITDGSRILAPDATGRVYRHVVTFPANETKVRVFFDILNFGGTDAVDGSVALESLSLEPLSLGRFSNAKSEVRQILAQPEDRALWSQVVAPPYREATFGATSRGLLVGAAGTDADNLPTTIGIWNLNTDVALQPNRAYRARFTVSANSSVSQGDRRLLTPAFRLRLSDSRFQQSTLLTLESVTESGRMPGFLQTEVYEAWFLAPPQLVSDKLVVAFDYIYSPPANNDPTINLVLEQLEVTSFDFSPPTN